MTDSKYDRVPVAKQSDAGLEPTEQSKYTQEETPHFSAFLASLAERPAEPESVQIISDVPCVLVKPGCDETARIGEERLQDKNTGAGGGAEDGSTALCKQGSQPIVGWRKCIEISPSKFTLGVWGFYFLAKIGMYWMEIIAFHPLLNLAFAGFILLPVASRPCRSIKNAITVVLAFVLLYYDSWLPSASHVIAQASNLSEFNFLYLIELLTRFISWPLIGVLLLAWGVYWLISRWVRAGVLVIIAMVVLGVVQSQIFQDFSRIFNGNEQIAENAMPDMDRVLQSFFDRESQRSVLFAKPVSVPFDVMFIHVCSLSWDDIVAVGLDTHPLWQRFDFLLTKFNSASSYSAPAAIHLLRATCGQQAHEKLYSPVPDNCYLMGSLQAVGFEPNIALNHTGKFDGFLEQVRAQGKLTAPVLSLDGVEIAQYAFNNSPIYDDLALLNRWLDIRNKSASPRVALYYNTTSLHDGNHFPGADAMPNTLKTYKVRLSRFLDGLESFMQKLDDSGRRAVVVMVPEHGDAVRGDKRQIAGLRDTPTPAITLVPVGIKVVGSNREGSQVSIDQPTSYLAISSLVARMLEKSPFSHNKFMPSDYIAELPITPFVAQTDKMTVVEYNHRFYFTDNAGSWENYTEFNAPAAKP